LQTFEGDREVILAKDAEGNAFSPCDDIQLDRYLADTTWSGELNESGEKCVVLFPVN